MTRRPTKDDRAGPGPVAVFSPPYEEPWTACLMMDMRARGLDVWDVGDPVFERSAVADGAGGLLVVDRSGMPSIPTPSGNEVTAVKGRGGQYAVVRRGGFFHGQDYPDAITGISLFDGYYQPTRSKAGTGDEGFATLLNLFGARGALDPAPGYVFVSYRTEDEAFVRTKLRPLISREGFATWDFRASERVPDPSTKARLAELVPPASVLLVVATPGWYGEWTGLELSLARDHGVGVVAVHPTGSEPCAHEGLAGVEVVALQPGRRRSAKLAAALRRAGAVPLAP